MALQQQRAGLMRARASDLLVCLAFAFFCAAMVAPQSVWAQSGPMTVAVEQPTAASTVADAAKIDFDILRSEIESAIQSSRRFDVLTRDKADLASIKRETEIANEEFGSSGDTGRLLVADFVVTPVVTEYSLRSGYTQIPNVSSRYKRTDRGKLTVQVQLLQTDGGRIVDTQSFSASFRTDRGITLNNRQQPGRAKFLSLCTDVAAKLSGWLIDTALPMKVIRRTNDTLFLNRGQGTGLETGQKLLVFDAGESLIDPDTGIDLGSAEMFVGTITVTRVNPKFSLAKILKEETKGVIQAGAIVREN